MNDSAERVKALHWDDVKVFLATMRASSLREAAEELGVSRPTAGRRLGALERRLGLQLFTRRTDGLHATAEAILLADAAEEVERAMMSLTRLADSANAELRGPVRVTVPGFLAAELLMPDIVAFCERWPRVDLHVDPSYDYASLADREADVAIRLVPHGKTPSLDLAGRLAATLYVAAYGTGDHWIGQAGGKDDAGWIQGSPFPDLPSKNKMFDASLQRSACAAGLGRTWLPCFYADPVLTRCSEPEPGVDVWVLVHPDLRRNPRLRAFRDAMVDALKRHQPALEGKR